MYVETLNFDQMTIPFKYLSMLVRANSRKKQFWKPTIDKIKENLNVWKGRYLNLAGRICLIKSIFTPLPLYYFFVFQSPNLCVPGNYKYTKKISMEMGSDTRRITWVSWSKICKTKKEVGLGIKKIGAFNKPY